MKVRVLPGLLMNEQNDESAIDEAIDQFNALDQCFWFVTECDSGHVHDIGAFSEEPPEKIICPECGGILWVNWDATVATERRFHWVDKKHLWFWVLLAICTLFAFCRCQKKVYDLGAK